MNFFFFFFVSYLKTYFQALTAFEIEPGCSDFLYGYKIVKVCNSPTEGVTQYCENCAASVKHFTGPTYEISKTWTLALEIYTKKVVILTEIESTIISSRSVFILETVGLMFKIGISPTIILNEFSDVLQQIVSGYENIISSLSGIGKLAVTVNTAITNLCYALHELIMEFQHTSHLNDIDDQLDYEPVLRNLHILTNTIAVIAETALSNCRIENDVKESIYVLVLILDHFLIMSHGTIASIAAVLYSSSVNISVTVQKYLKPVNPLVSGIAVALSKPTTSITESVTVVFETLVSLTRIFNVSLQKTVGFSGGGTITVAQTTNILTLNTIRIATARSEY